MRGGGAAGLLAVQRLTQHRHRSFGRNALNVAPRRKPIPRSVRSRLAGRALQAPAALNTREINSCASVWRRRRCSSPAKLSA